MNTKKWEYDKMLNQYNDTENKEFDNSLNFVNPVYYRIDPDTGEKFFKYNEPPQYNLELHGFESTPEFNAFRRNIYNSTKPNENNFDTNKAFQTAMYYWLDVNVPLSYNYWVNKKDYHLENAVHELMTKMGYAVNYTEHNYDNGVDLRAWIGGENLSIQCKGTNRVGPAIIREAVGVRVMENDTFSHQILEDINVVVVCPRGFTEQSKYLAKKHKVLLVDAFGLCAAYRGESNPFCFNNVRRIDVKPFELFIDEHGNEKIRTNVYI